MQLQLVPGFAPAIVCAALAAGLSVAGAPPVAAQIVFHAPIDHELIADSVQDLVAGDADDDGIIDVLVATGTGGVELLAGLGDAGLAPPVQVVAGPAHDIDLGDVDGDGDLDLLVVGDDIRIHFNLAGGGYFPGPPINVNLFPDAALLADLTADGVLDVILLESGSGGLGHLVVLRPGLGNGSFGSAQNVDAAFFFLQFPSSARVADIDGNGLPDLAVLVLAGDANSVRVYLASAPGLFGGPVSSNVTGSYNFELGDVDLDGLPDLLLSSVYGAAIKFGAGDGTFGPVTLVDGKMYAPFCPIIQADYDLDGVPDLAVSGSFTTDGVHVFRGLGDGLLAEPLPVTHPQPHFHALGADLDGDLRTDLVTSAEATGGAISVFRNASYLPGEPFADLGHALPYQTAALPVVQPIQLAEGTLQAGEPVSFRVENAWHDGGAQAWLVVGGAAGFGAFKGGTLVPVADLLIGPLGLGAGTTADVSGLMPPGVPAGTPFWTQYWIQGVDGPAGFGATPAVLAEAP